MWPNVIEVENAKVFAGEGARLLTTIIKNAIVARGYCCMGLSGGSTPGPIYTALGRCGEIDWAKVWLFLVDDRYVREDSPHSNQFLLRSLFLRTAPIPESQLIFPDTTHALTECVRLYDAWIADLVRTHPVDLVVLGMGEDGHTASLFPPLPDHAFGPAHAIATEAPASTAIRPRISVTLPVLEDARTRLLLLQGKRKREIWEAMTASAEDKCRWPVKALLDPRTTVLLCP